MREIKFRVWDKNNLKNDKQMLYMKDITREEVKNEGSYKEKVLNILTYINSTRYIVMQYTTFKDKNGVEIYEDDILKVSKLSFDNKNEFEPFICKVEFYMGNFHLYVNKMLLLCYGDTVEVIGNIYENKGKEIVAIQQNQIFILKGNTP